MNALSPAPLALLTSLEDSGEFIRRHIAPTEAETAAMLRAAGLTLDEIPEPVRRRVKSVDFVASYANFYVCNGAVIAAAFGDPDTDAQALAALRRHFPGREVVTLNVDALGEIGGGIHCATHEVPSA